MIANEDKIKVGTVLIANDNHFMVESAKRQFLTKKKEYVIHRFVVVNFVFAVVSDINEDHQFDIDTYEEFFTIKEQ